MAEDRVRLAVVGARRGGSFIQQAQLLENVELAAVCDTNPEVLDRWRGKCPDAQFFDEYQELLAADVCDAVMIATPPTLHAEQSIQALDAGRHVLVEVISGMTVDEIWDVVRAVERNECVYMMAENVCYYRTNLMVQNMVQQSVFGELTYAVCGYVHDCKPLISVHDGKGTWRYEWQFERRGNFYPTHAIGPVAWWLDLGRSDRMVSMVSMDSPSLSFQAHLKSDSVPNGHPSREETRGTTLPDLNKTLIKTERGRIIDLWFDVNSSRPHMTTTPFMLQGMNGVYDNDFGRNEYVYLKDRTDGWGSLWDFADEFEHPLWKEHLEDVKNAGHGGADYFTLLEFARSVTEGTPSPIDVYDAADWSAIIPLSQESVLNGSQPVEFPDFRMVSATSVKDSV